MKGFFQQEDIMYKKNYQSWLEESKNDFNYDSDIENTVVQDHGEEYSKVTIEQDSIAQQTNTKSKIKELSNTKKDLAEEDQEEDKNESIDSEQEDSF